MKPVMVLLMCLILSGVASGDSPDIPWEEFKALYRASIERELEAAAPAPKQPPVYSLDTAQYTLTITDAIGLGEVLLAGKVVSGDPAPIPLFGAGFVFTGLEAISGGTVVTVDGGGAFLPDAGARDFQLSARFLVAPQEENGARLLTLPIPNALQNTLTLKLPDKARLLEAPGMEGADGVRHFAAANGLSIRYQLEQETQAARAIEIDTLSRIRLVNDRLLISTAFSPIRPLPDKLILRVPEGSAWIASSLKESSFTKQAEGTWEIRVSPGITTPFSVDFQLQAGVQEGNLSFPLPGIMENSGRQGRFVVEEPDDGQIIVTAPDLVSGIPLEKLGESLAGEAGAALSFHRVAADTPITLAIRRFQSISTPATVLDCQYFFCAFEENGNTLCVLSLDLPAGFGERFNIKAIPDAEIWSLRVNGESRNLYAQEEGRWMIPLAAGQTSHVELAFLRKGAKIGLQGRLEAMIPETGIPSKEIRVAVLLPGRVELLSLDGPVAPVSAGDWPQPAEITGVPLRFSQAYYKGEGMTLALAYKEPLKNGK